MPTLNPDGVSVKGCSHIYAPKGQAGEYAPLAANPYRGCGHRCAYCLDGDTLIQMADGTAKKLSAVREGSDVLGVTKRLGVRRAWNYTFGPSHVEATLMTRSRAYRVTLDNGSSVVCSEDHPWLTERGWKVTARLTPRNQIRTFPAPIETPAPSEHYDLGYLAGIIEGDGAMGRYDYSGRYRRNGRSAPQKTDVQHHFRLAMKDAEAIERAFAALVRFGVAPRRFIHQEMPAIRTSSRSHYELVLELLHRRPSREWARGWLAGIFDAEGCTSAGVPRIYNTDPRLLETTEVAAADLGFSVVRDRAKANGCAAVRVRGGLAEAVRFFNLAGPAIARKFPAVGKHLKGASRVVEIEPLARNRPMLDITTSTENFLAAGMVSHNCYVPLVLRMKRRDFDAGAVPRQNFLRHLIRDARKYQALGIREQVMLSFTTDVYNTHDTSLTRRTIEILREHGLGFCVLTKGGRRALADIDLYRPDRDAFASTLTSLDDEISFHWERDAALPQDRMDTLRTFHGRGVFTWVSLEPVLDVEAAEAIVRETHRFVDLFKIGRANYVSLTKTTDWEAFTHRMMEVCSELGAKHYFKKDLQPYLPEGYPNPLRVQQHH